MTALAEALLAAQRQAVAAMEKHYVAGDYESDDAFRAALDLIGCTDKLEQEWLLASLKTMTTWGVQANPKLLGNGKPDAASEPASEKQLAFLASLADEKGTLAPDRPLSKAEASQAIDELRAGSYDPDKWRAPF